MPARFDMLATVNDFDGAAELRPPDTMIGSGWAIGANSE